MQLDADGRGFSFRRDEPLDMRMDQSQGPTAADLLAAVDEKELADLIFQHGEERFSRRIARGIVEARRAGPITTTGQLAQLVRRAVPKRGYQRIDPATRTFQAIRIWVNRELEQLETFLAEACARLLAGARLAVITFHSLEDRIVKHAFRALAQGGVALRILTKRPIVPGDDGARSQSPRAQRQAARHREGGMTARRGLDFEYAIKKDVRNNPIVREIDEERQRQLWRTAGISAVLVLVLLFSAWQTLELVLHGYEVQRLERERASEEEVNRHLRLEIETLRSPRRIEEVATRELKLVAPDRDQAIVIERVAPSTPPDKSIVALRGPGRP